MGHLLRHDGLLYDITTVWQVKPHYQKSLNNNNNNNKEIYNALNSPKPQMRSQ